jgi:hypothetical protein
VTQHEQPIVLRPFPETRVLNLAPAAFLLTLAIIALIVPNSVGEWWTLIALGTIALAACLAIRAWRYSGLVIASVSCVRLASESLSA